MGFLEGLGRSRAITGTLSAIDQLKANEQNRAINEQNLRMNEMDLMQQQRKMQYEQQQLDAQAADAAQKVDVNYSPIMLRLHPETRELIKKSALEAGVIDEKGWGQKGAWQKHLDEWEKTEEKLKIFSETELQGQKNDIDKALQEKYELEEKGNADPNKLALAQKKVDMLTAKYLIGANKAEKAIELLRGQGQEKPKISNLKTVDESGNPVYLTEYGEPTGIRAYESLKDVEPYKVGTVREFVVGDRKIYKTYKGNGQWEDMKGVGGGRYKATVGGAGGTKASDKYQKDVEAYKKEVAGLELTYQTKRNAFPTNSNADIKERNEINKWYAKERDSIVKKYRGKIDFISDTTAPTTNMEKKMGSEWSEGGRKFRINPQTGKKEMWVQ